MLIPTLNFFNWIVIKISNFFRGYNKWELIYTPNAPEFELPQL